MVAVRDNVARKSKACSGLTFHPLTPQRWEDFETLFGERGACGGCWCMWWHLTRSEFERQKGAGNRRAMKKMVNSGRVPGILAYDGSEPVGWCSVGPRESFPALGRSRVLAPVDDSPVWSVVCLFIPRPYRRVGVSAELLKAAVDFAKKSGASVVEGYPFDVSEKKKPQADAFVWTGLLSAYERAGFIEVLRRSPTRPIVRRMIKAKTRR